jgi:hypothetical protein
MSKHKKVPNVNIALLRNNSLRSRCKYSIHYVHKGQIEYCKVGTHAYCNFGFAWGYCRDNTHVHCDFWCASGYCMVNTMHNVLLWVAWGYCTDDLHTQCSFPNWHVGIAWLGHLHSVVCFKPTCVACLVLVHNVNLFKHFGVVVLGYMHNVIFFKCEYCIFICRG